MPTALVGTILLTLRGRGVGRDEVKKQIFGDGCLLVEMSRIPQLITQTFHFSSLFLADSKSEMAETRNH
jgi:hypothetical protein